MTYERIDQIENGMKVRLMFRNKPVWDFKLDIDLPVGVGVVHSTGDARDSAFAYLGLGTDGRAPIFVHRNANSYNMHIRTTDDHYHWEQLIETVNYKADQEADESEDLL